MINELNVPRMVTINEAAQITGLAKYSIRQLILQGKICYITAGKKYLVNLDKLFQYLNNGEIETSKPAESNYKIRAVEV